MSIYETFYGTPMKYVEAMDDESVGSRAQRCVELVFPIEVEQWKKPHSPFSDMPTFPGVVYQPVSFKFERSWFDSYAMFERKIRIAKREIQSALKQTKCDTASVHANYEPAVRKLEECVSQRPVAAVAERFFRLGVEPELRLQVMSLDRKLRRLEFKKAALDEYLGKTNTLLWDVSQAVDAELESGNGSRERVQAMRADPNRPQGIREYASLTDFVAENEVRGFVRDGRLDGSGADFGYDWSLENPLAPWNTTQWRISWVTSSAGSTYEMYAQERWSTRVNRSSSDSILDGRVWLLGRLPDWASVTDVMLSLERNVMRERNSLVVAAEIVRDASTRLEDQPPDHLRFGLAG